MELNIQIYSFICSFLFGCILNYLLDIFNKLILNVKIYFKIVISFVFILLLASIYFLILLFINNGVIHIYFLLCILFGYIFNQRIILFCFTRMRKK